MKVLKNQLNMTEEVVPKREFVAVVLKSFGLKKKDDMAKRAISFSNSGANMKTQTQNMFFKLLAKVENQKGCVF